MLKDPYMDSSMSRDPRASSGLKDSRGCGVEIHIMKRGLFSETLCLYRRTIHDVMRGWHQS